MKLVVNGAESIRDLPGLEPLGDDCDILFAPDRDSLSKALPGADVLLGWNFQSRDMQEQWHLADSLSWIHWCGASVDRVMAPELAASDILLTNARGIFDGVMAEYILGYMLAELKNFRETFELQQRKEWQTRLTGRLAGSTAVIFGVGSIGRTTARLLRANGVKVFGVGRSARQTDPDFEQIIASGQESSVLTEADWVIGLMPLTVETDGYFNDKFFTGMKPSARFMNLGRGESVDETALIAALDRGQIAGAMLDVFHDEPLAKDRAIWDAANIVVSPHTSSYYAEYQEDMVQQFLDNLARFRRGAALQNVVDTSIGFVPSAL